MPIIELERPCSVDDLGAVAPQQSFGFGLPLDTASFEWPSAGSNYNFERLGIIREDKDWDRVGSKPTRFLLLHDGHGLLLRWGLVSDRVSELRRIANDPGAHGFRSHMAKQELEKGIGTHRQMCSLAELERSVSAGHPPLGGYIRHITPQYVAID